MRYFLDTEFLEGKQDKRFLGIKYGETKPTIDLISIGVVSEDNREYYAISKEFNLKEAWNRYDIVGDNKVYWIRENILRPIYNELDSKAFYDAEFVDGKFFTVREDFTYRKLEALIKFYGKTRKQIANEVKDFCQGGNKFINPADPKDKDSYFCPKSGGGDWCAIKYFSDPEFCGYYSAYDHVAFCWLFGKMIDLPKGFPMYTKDLKQILDKRIKNSSIWAKDADLEFRLKELKNDPQYNFPQQEDNHHALADARWNKKLYNWLNTF